MAELITNSKQTDNKPLATSWCLKTKTLSFEQGSALMGIVNVTPDSFSDGGNLSSSQHAIEHALQLIDDGAAIIDIGGESTRPYSEPVDELEELRRVIPVIEKLSEQASVPISIDTSKAKVAFEAIAAGAEIINDVTGLSGDPKMVSIAIESACGVCAMHMQGIPQVMQDDPQYDDVVDDILTYLRDRQNDLISLGILSDRICLDPGIGFGKTHQHNIELMQNIGRFHELNAPILVGHSRKGFIGKLSNDSSKERTAGTIAATLHLVRNRIQIIRVHDVKAMSEAIKVHDALQR